MVVMQGAASRFGGPFLLSKLSNYFEARSITERSWWIWIGASGSAHRTGLLTF
jgi:hypothetical protein